MKLYHGSNILVKSPDLKFAKKGRDFGVGFYLTSYKEQAQRWALRKTREGKGHAYVSIYTFDEIAFESNGLNIKVFNGISEDWATFVKNCRLEIQDLNSNWDFKYDIIIGEVANDRMYALFELFEAGEITAEVFVSTLKYKEKSNQYSFHTEKSLNYMKYLESYIVGGNK